MSRHIAPPSRLQFVEAMGTGLIGPELDDGVPLGAGDYARGVLQSDTIRMLGPLPSSGLRLILMMAVKRVIWKEGELGSG